MCIHHPGSIASTVMHINNEPAPVAERSKVRVCGLSLVGIAGSNPAEGIDVSAVCYQVEVSLMNRYVVQRSLPTVVCHSV